jgi:hypothetical protein
MPAVILRRAWPLADARLEGLRTRASMDSRAERLEG